MQQGISLIELLIVLAVTGILAAIAYPRYNDHLRQAARHEVVALLQDAALRLERHRFGYWPVCRRRPEPAFGQPLLQPASAARRPDFHPARPTFAKRADGRRPLWRFRA